MIENNTSNVLAAFEILMEEIEAEIDLTNNIATRAINRRDYDEVREVIKHADQVTAYRDKIASLRREWRTLEGTQGAKLEGKDILLKRRNLGRLQRGLRTPEIAFFQPILKALIELNGSAEMDDVLEKVEQSMKGVLRQVDFEPLASGTDMLRWRNTAKWARNTMKEEGLLKSNSPQGIWEITETGRRAFSDQWKTFGQTQGDKSEEKIIPSKPHSYKVETVIGTKPITVSILGQSLAVNSWRDVFVRTMNTIVDLRPEKFGQIIRQFPHFVGLDGKKFTKAQKLKNGTFIEVNLSALSILHNCSQALEMVELSTKDFIVVTARRKDGQTLRIPIPQGRL